MSVMKALGLGVLGLAALGAFIRTTTPPTNDSYDPTAEAAQYEAKLVAKSSARATVSAGLPFIEARPYAECVKSIDSQIRLNGMAQWAQVTGDNKADKFYRVRVAKPGNPVVIFACNAGEVLIFAETS